MQRVRHEALHSEGALCDSGAVAPVILERTPRGCPTSGHESVARSGRRRRLRGGKPDPMDIAAARKGQGEPLASRVRRGYPT